MLFRSSIGDEEIPDTLSEGQFKEIWDSTSKKYYVKRKNFLRIIEETIESVFTIGQLQENYNRFNSNEFQSYLNQTDKEYVEDLRQIFAALLRYNEESEFDYKADTLGRADEIRKRLEEKIADNPTYISFEKLLPMLTQLQAKIFKESSQLYGDSEPDIKVELSGDCSIDEANMIVRVPIAYTNKNNVQNADNVSTDDKDKSGKISLKAERFNEFWNLYPKKRKKKDAEKAWEKLKLTEELYLKIISQVKLNIENNPDWRKDNGQFIPYPASWLNSGSWDDEIFIGQSGGLNNANTAKAGDSDWGNLLDWIPSG